MKEVLHYWGQLHDYWEFLQQVWLVSGGVLWTAFLLLLLKVQVADPKQKLVHLNTILPHQTVSQTVKLVNHSLAPASFDVGLSPRATLEPGVLTIKPHSDIFLGPGASCNVIVTFSPLTRMPRFKEEVGEMVDLMANCQNTVWSETPTDLLQFCIIHIFLFVVKIILWGQTGCYDSWNKEGKSILLCSGCCTVMYLTCKDCFASLVAMLHWLWLLCAMRGCLFSLRQGNSYSWATQRTCAFHSSCKERVDLSVAYWIFIFSFAPLPASRQIFMDCSGTSVLLFTVSAACISREVSLDHRRLAFGDIVKDSSARRQIILSNSGDLPTRYQLENNCHCASVHS